MCPFGFLWLLCHTALKGWTPALAVRTVARARTSTDFSEKIPSVRITCQYCLERLKFRALRPFLKHPQSTHCFSFIVTIDTVGTERFYSLLPPLCLSFENRSNRSLATPLQTLVLAAVWGEVCFLRCWRTRVRQHWPARGTLLFQSHLCTCLKD